MGEKEDMEEVVMEEEVDTVGEEVEEERAVTVGEEVLVEEVVTSKGHKASLHQALDSRQVQRWVISPLCMSNSSSVTTHPLP